MQEVQTVSRPAATSRTAVEREARQQASITYRVVLPATEPKTVEPDVENYDATYWYHPSIHNWGNIGWRGRFHATFAPLATWVIDQTSYSGIDVRRAVLSNTTLFPPGASVLDLACGTGFSTSRGAVGIDTSPEMIDIARLRRGDALFRQGNAETYGETNGFEVVSCMFATHEMPVAGRRRVLRNAMRVARKSVVVVDIDPDFQETLRAKPGQGKPFLAGEPCTHATPRSNHARTPIFSRVMASPSDFCSPLSRLFFLFFLPADVLEYLKQMDNDVTSCVPVRIAAQGWKVTRFQLLPKHVVVWHLERAS